MVEHATQQAEPVFEQSQATSGESLQEFSPPQEASRISLFSRHESSARLSKGLDTQDTQVNNPELGLISSDLSFDGTTASHYDPGKRSDHLKEFRRTNLAGGVETSRLYEGRTDGLLLDRKVLKAEVSEFEQIFDAAARADGKQSLHEIKTSDGVVSLSFSQFDSRKSENGLSYESKSAERDGTVKTTRAYSGHPEGLNTETIEQSGNGIRSVGRYEDGRRVETFSLTNGLIVESKAYDKDGKLLVPGRSNEQVNEQEAHLARYREDLESKNFNLAPLQKGWGPYQALQQAALEQNLQFTPKQLRDEALRIRNREFAQADRTSFSVGEKLQYLSSAEIDQAVALEKSRFLSV